MIPAWNRGNVGEEESDREFGKREKRGEHDLKASVSL